MQARTSLFNPSTNSGYYIDQGKRPLTDFSTWSYESDRPFSLKALQEMILTKLPASVYRGKGVIYAMGDPEKVVV